MPAIVPRPVTLDARGLSDLDGGHARLGDLGVELDLALGDDAEHGLRRARRIAADARHAAADDAVGGRHHLGAAAPPRQLAALGLDLRLLGLGRREAVAGGDELGLRRARRLLAGVVGALGHVAGGAQGLGPLERVAALDQAGLGLHDAAAGLGDGRRGAREAGVVLRQLGVERVGDQPRQHVALLHAHALVGQHLGDAQALDLGSDQDFLARHQRAGGQHRLHEIGGRDAGDRHRRGKHQRFIGRRRLGNRRGCVGGAAAAAACRPASARSSGSRAPARRRSGSFS